MHSVLYIQTGSRYTGRQGTHEFSSYKQAVCTQEGNGDMHSVHTNRQSAHREARDTCIQYIHTGSPHTGRQGTHAFSTYTQAVRTHRKVRDTCIQYIQTGSQLTGRQETHAFSTYTQAVSTQGGKGHMHSVHTHRQSAHREARDTCIQYI
jgi:hypothetical protein